MSNNILSIKQLGFKVDDNTILSEISFSMNKGELMTISGPSGSGKSTLLKLISNTQKKKTGDIFFNEKKLEDYVPTEYRKEVSYLFQNPVLFGETVKDNLVFPYEIRQKEFDQTRAISLLKDVQLSEEFLDKRIDSLSGGEKQRVAFVRNLLFPPQILLLDEVTSALDEENSRIIREMIYRLNKDEHLTVLWITHNKEEFLSSKRRLFIEDGLIKENTHE